MKKIIRKSSGAMLMANPKIEIEVRYTNRPEFQKLMNDLREDKTDMIIMLGQTFLSLYLYSFCDQTEDLLFSYI